MQNKKRVRINENQLNKIVSQSIRRVLREQYGQDTTGSMVNGDVQEIINAIPAEVYKEAFVECADQMWDTIKRNINMSQVSGDVSVLSYISNLDGFDIMDTVDASIIQKIWVNQFRSLLQGLGDADMYGYN